MTTNNAAASQLKLNVTNIKSVLVKGNKSMTRLKAFKAKTIFNMEQDQKKSFIIYHRNILFEKGENQIK